MQKSGINYKQIFSDILNIKYPQKKEECLLLLQKEKLSVIDVIKINKVIFGLPDKEKAKFNQTHRSYNRSAILQILDYQKKNKLNNSQLANHFNLSRNTVAKWKKLFLI